MGSKGRESLVDELLLAISELEESRVELQNSVDTLRVHVKYLLFDVEASRRESAHLRKLLEE